MAKCNAEQFFSIDPDIIVETRPLTFDVFVHMALSDRIILFWLSGDILGRGKIEHMKSKGLKAFHVRVEHRAAYQQYMALVEADRLAALRDEHKRKLEEAKKAGTDSTGASNAPLAKEPEAPVAETPKPTAEEAKKEFVPEVKPEDVLRGLLDDDADSRKKAKEESKKMVEKVLKGPPKLDPTTQQILDSPETEHATNVAIYSVLFAMGLGEKNQVLLQDLIIASLLHDIGVTQTAVELLALPTMQRSPVQAKQFEAHVESGLSLLEELDYKPNERVVLMMSQHHEKFNGTGFPKHLESFRIDELAQIVSFADLLDTLCCGRHDGVERELAQSLEVLAGIEKQTTFPQYFNPDLFKRLMRWLKDTSGKDYMKQAVSAVEQTKEKLSKAG